MADSVQCSDCGRMVDYLVDDGVCQTCFNNRDED